MTANGVRQLEERITSIEQELREIKAMLRGADSERPWWERIAGSHKGSKVFAEIVRLGQEIRKKDRERAKRHGKKAVKK